MSGSILEILLRSPWSIPIAIFCLSLSIFVHELGHFLVARWRGVYADRFSFFGLGKPIVSWHWRGVEWCICWIPIGAYVSIPQLADLGEIEGGSDPATTRKLPAISYTDKVLVSVAGAAFNLVLALLIGTVLWIAGENVTASSRTTTIGHVAETLVRADGKEGPSPAKIAGLRPFDVIRSIDGAPTSEWDDVVQALVLGGGKSSDGRRQADFAIERDGKPMVIVVYPELATVEKIRRVGIAPVEGWSVGKLEAGKPGQLAGLQLEDRIVAVDGKTLYSWTLLSEALKQPAGTPVKLTVENSGQRRDVTLASVGPKATGEELGVAWRPDTVTIHVPPHIQVWNQIRNVFRLIGSLVNRNSDINLSKVSGPIGIVTFLAAASLSGVLTVLAVMMAVNVSFAVLNLLPIPVLDGGHILFATIGKLRGKALPTQFITATTFAFFVGLISLMIYVAPHDARRAYRPLDEPAPKKPDAAPANPEPGSEKPEPASPPAAPKP